MSAAVAIKRFLIGLYLGRQTFAHYGEKLAKVMSDMLLISEVSELAKDIERRRVEQGTAIPLLSESFGWNLCGGGFGDDGTASIPGVEDASRKIIDPSSRDPLTGSLPAHEKAKLFAMLGQWEEPTRPSDPRQVTINRSRHVRASFFCCAEQTGCVFSFSLRLHLFLQFWISQGVDFHPGRPRKQEQ